jgi:uncharacterized oxidoreductase
MDLMAEVRPGANRYISGDGILQELPLYINKFKNIAVITGVKSYEVFCEYYGKKIDYPTFVYDGSASDEDGQRLANEIKNADAIIAIGGGRLLDTAKLTAEILGSELIIIPTLISNCAPYTPITVVYTQKNHEFKRIGVSSKAVYVTLVDWKLLLKTPKDYFVAGIGDTLAKWYECDAITRHLKDDEKKACVKLGIAAAKEIFNILLTNSGEALNALEKGKVTPAFGQTADTIIALAGCVGGFAEKYGRISGAHAVHNALSLIQETHEILHGTKVAYGILVQLAYTGDFAEIKTLIPRFKELGLAVKLADLGIIADDKRLPSVAEFAAKSEESFVYIDSEVTADKVLKAMEQLEVLND